MTNYLGQWNPNKAYFGLTTDGTTPHPGGEDMVSYLGATWICNYYTVGMPPVFATPGDTGMWRLAPGSASPNYNPVAPEAPTHVVAGYTDSSTISLFWTASEVHGLGEVTHYDIYDNGAKIGTSIDPTFTAKGLAAGSAHNFTIDAVDAFGTSLASTGLAAQTDGAQDMSGKYYSPYVDMGLVGFDLLDMSRDAGIRNFTLAFMQGSNASLNNNGDLIDNADFGIGWGGQARVNISEATIIEEVRAIEAGGGDVTISFGGYTGRDAAVGAHQYTDDLKGAPHHLSDAQAQAQAVNKLEGLYQSVVSTYGVNHLDFDVENDVYKGVKYNVVDDDVASHLRNLALVELQQVNPDLHVSFTVPTMPGGLPGIGSDSGDVIGVIADAAADGVKFDVVNIMAMDYGDNSGGSMGEKAILAATNVHQQLLALGLDEVKVAITPMIGQNDVLNEVFRQSDAQLLEQFALKTSWVAGLGEWELMRDVQQTSDHLGEASSYYSGVAQDQYEFSSILSKIDVRAGAGNDLVEGDEQATALSGLDGNDVIKGYDGADILNGGAGTDMIYGGRGGDSLLGGAGHDRFVYERVNDSTARDFDHINDLSNQDWVNLRKVDADTTTAGNQNFHLGGDHFTHSKGELILFYDSANKTTWIEADTDGDGDSDFTIAARGNHVDFVHFVL